MNFAKVEESLKAADFSRRTRPPNAICDEPINQPRTLGVSHQVRNSADDSRYWSSWEGLGGLEMQHARGSTGVGRDGRRLRPRAAAGARHRMTCLHPSAWCVGIGCHNAII